MSADTAPEAGGTLANRADELKAKAAQAEAKAKAAQAWAVQLMTKIGAGSTLLGKTLAERLKGWCLQAHRSDLKGLSADLGIYVRGALLAGAAAGLGWVVNGHRILMWPLVGAWCLAALRTQLSAEKAEAAKEEPPTAGSKTAVGGAPGPSPAAFINLLHDLVEEHSEGSKITPGLHWPQVVTGLSSRYPGGGSSGGWSAADCRRLCEAAAVPISRGTRARGEGAAKGVSTGVRTQDLPDRPPLPSPGPSPEGAPGPDVAVVSAGQIQQQPGQQQQQQGADNTPEGVGARIVQDPDNPARYLVKPAA